MNASMNAVFRALADPSRRRMLDLLRARPCMTVGELAEHFEFSRFAVMKHLRVLEGANLVVSVKEGRCRRLHLNTMPIQAVHDRWLSKYAALWAASLSSLKHTLEQEESAMSSSKLLQIFVTYIRTTPERLWQALTDPEMTPLYFHGTRVRSDFEVGSSIEYMLTGDSETFAVVCGEVLEAEPGRRLVHCFSFTRLEDAPTRVTYLLEPLGETVKLTVKHEEFEGETETFEDTREGWPPILSGLKTLLETGRPLEIPDEE